MTDQHKDGVEKPAGEGESSGGAYPNPHKGQDNGGFDGGQSGKGYEGPDNPNATTSPEGADAAEAHTAGASDARA